MWRTRKIEPSATFPTDRVGAKIELMTFAAGTQEPRCPYSGDEWRLGWERERDTEGFSFKGLRFHNSTWYSRAALWHGLSWFKTKVSWGKFGQSCEQTSTRPGTPTIWCCPRNWSKHRAISYQSLLQSLARFWSLFGVVTPISSKLVMWGHVQDSLSSPPWESLDWAILATGYWLRWGCWSFDSGALCHDLN